MIRTILLFIPFAWALQVNCQCEKPNELPLKERYTKKITTGYSYENGVEKIVHIQTSSYDKKGLERSYIFQHTTDDLKKTQNTNYFDSNGNLIRQIRRNPEGNISDSLLYKYDDRGNNIDLAMWRGASFDSYSVFTYDENCNQTAYIAYQYDSTLWFHYAQEYDENNNLISFTDVSHTGETEKYERDSNGEILSVTVTDKEGNILSKRKSETQRDKKGNPILILWKDETDQLVGKEEHTYKKGVLVESKSYEGDELTSHKLYDKRGNLVFSMTYSGGNPKWKTTFEYEYYK